jgi:hypothetical protein
MLFLVLEAKLYSAPSSVGWSVFIIAMGDTTASWKYLAQSSSSEGWGLYPQRLGPLFATPKAAKLSRLAMLEVRSW